MGRVFYFYVWTFDAASSYSEWSPSQIFLSKFNSEWIWISRFENCQTGRKWKFCLVNFENLVQNFGKRCPLVHSSEISEIKKIHKVGKECQFCFNICHIFGGNCLFFLLFFSEKKAYLIFIHVLQSLQYFFERRFFSE